MLKLLHSRRRSWRKKITCGFKISGTFPQVPYIFTLIVEWFFTKIEMILRVIYYLLERKVGCAFSWYPRTQRLYGPIRIYKHFGAVNSEELSIHQPPGQNCAHFKHPVPLQNSMLSADVAKETVATNKVQ